MSDFLSDRIKQVAPSMTLAITAKAKALKAAGEDVVGFGAGEPDFPTPQPVRQAAIAAIEAGHTSYTAVDGIADLKDAVAARCREDHGLEYSAEQIAVTVGAKQAIYNLIQVAVNPGDGVLIPAPYWVSYPDQVRLAGGEPQIVQTDEDNGFRVTPAAIEAAITEKSKILILNSPCNPTGAALDRAELEAIAEVVKKHGLYVISDEIYEKLVYDGFKQTSIAELSDAMYQRTAVVNGVSKAYAMTGWRIGYMCGPKEWVRAAAKLQGQSTSNPTSIAQYAAVEALRLPSHIVEEMRVQFEQRRDLIVERLNAIDGVQCQTPRGAFYVFPNISNAISGRWQDSAEFAQALIEAEKVAVVPGDAFAAPGYVRLSYACSTDDINKGLDRIASFLNG